MRMKNLYLCIALLVILSATNEIFAENNYDYKQNWDVRLRITDNYDGEYLDKIERNEEKTDWEAEPEKVVQSLFLAAKANNKEAFNDAFDSNTTKQVKIDEFFNWMRPHAKYWGRIDIMALGRSVKDKNFVFFAIVTEDEPRIPPENYDDITAGFKKVIYLKQGTDGWKVCLDYKDIQLESLLDDEVFVSRAGFSFPSMDFELSKAESKKFHRKQERKAEIIEKEELNSFLSDYAKYYPKEDLIRKYNLLKAMDESDPNLINPYAPHAVHTEDEAFKYMIKKGMIKVFEKPVIIPDISAPLEEGLSESNPFDFIRKNLHWEYTKPDEKIKTPSGYEFMATNYYRTDNLKAFQAIYYTIVEFDGETFYQLSGLLYNPDEIFEGECKEKQFRLKIYPGNKLDFAESDEPERISFLHKISQTNASLDSIIYDDKTEKEKLYGCSGSRFKKMLEKYGLCPVFWIHKPENCIPYKPGLDLYSLPTLRVDDNTFKKP